MLLYYCWLTTLPLLLHSQLTCFANPCHRWFTFSSSELPPKTVVTLTVFSEQLDFILLAQPASRCHRRAYILLMLLPFLMSPLSFGNGWTDRNADSCVNTVDEKIPTVKHMVKFGSVTPENLWLICMGGDCREANIRSVLVRGHPLGGVP